MTRAVLGPWPVALSARSCAGQQFQAAVPPGFQGFSHHVRTSVHGRAPATRGPAQVDDGPCVTYIGDGGAGNFVKMVHNGIEYGDMQLISEAYDVLKTLGGFTNEELCQTFTNWNKACPGLGWGLRVHSIAGLRSCARPGPSAPRGAAGLWRAGEGLRAEGAGVERGLALMSCASLPPPPPHSAVCAARSHS